MVAQRDGGGAKLFFGVAVLNWHEQTASAIP